MVKFKLSNLKDINNGNVIFAPAKHQTYTKITFR